MNLDKAREHYSAYYEGSLDRGLRQNFDRMLIENDDLAADYRAFEVFMDRLSTMRAEEPEAPSELFDMISARIDRNVYEQRQNTKVGFWGTWLRPLAIGVAAVAILGLGFLQMNGAFKGAATPAGVVPQATADAHLKVEPTAGGVRLSYPSGPTSSVILRKSEEEVIERVPIGPNQSMVNKPVSNPDVKPQIIEVLIGKTITLIALPGTEKWSSELTSGSLRDFALALAGKYQVPVMLQVRNEKAAVSWDLTGEKMLDSATAAIAPQGLKASVSSAGDFSLLQIEDN